MHLALVAKGSRAISGELERVFEDYSGMVFRTAYRITGNAADAEDVLQTVFLRLLGRDPSRGELANPDSYLRRAAINVALDVVRARQRAAESPIDDSMPAAEHRDLRDSLRRALATLDPRHAEIFALRFFEGHTNREIAHMTGMSTVLVAVTIYRARQRLQKEIRTQAAGGKS